MIKKQKIDLSEERKILSYMITSTNFLTQLQPIAKSKYFQSSFTRIVSDWIWEYFEHTNEAPGKNIQEIYLKKRPSVQDEDDLEIISEFLQNLSKDWEKSEIQNIPYTVKNAIEFFKLRSLDQLKEKLEGAIFDNDSTFAEKIISEYKNVDRPLGKGINLLKDTSSIVRAFNQEQEFLFSFPGAMGEFIGPLMRGEFFAWLGAMKKGKTHYLWLTAYRALLSGLKVLFISLEMTQEQMIRRMWQTMVGQPLKTETIKTPYFNEIEDGLFEVKTKEKNIKGIDLTKVGEKQEFYKKYIRTGELKLLCYPSGGITVKDIENELNNYEYYENFVPDVLVVDYADLLKSNEREYRHKIDDIWKSLRGIAQQKSILSVTASQTGKQGMSRDVGAEDTAEDYRKLAHVTKMISLNQTKKEKEDGIIRMEEIVKREGAPSFGQLIVLQSLKVGRPYMDSQLKKNVNMKKYTENKA